MPINIIPSQAPADSFTSPSLFDPIPFSDNKKYTGSIEVIIEKRDHSFLIKAIGERLTLETFTEPYYDQYKEKFTSLSPKKPEFHHLQRLFQTVENVKQYLSGNIHSDADIAKRHDRDSKRPVNGDVFTGFAVVDKKTKQIIGRAAVGSGEEAAESQMGLIIDHRYHNKKFGKETALLMAAVALTYFENQFMVGDGKPENLAPVRVFRASVLDSNKSRSLMEQGMERISSKPEGMFQRILCALRINDLFRAIGFPLNIRGFYEIRGEDIRSKLTEQMDITKLNISVR